MSDLGMVFPRIISGPNKKKYEQGHKLAFHKEKKHKFSINA